MFIWHRPPAARSGCDRRGRRCRCRRPWRTTWRIPRVRNERHTPVAPLPPNGPSPSRPANICSNMELRNTDFEILRGGARLGVVGDGHRPLAMAEAASRSSGLQAGGGEGGIGCHHITSMSAWMAPAALIACRIAIRSRGPMPSALSPSTSCCSDTPSSHQRELLAVLLHADAGARHD